MVTFHWPWALLALTAVVAGAVAALRRPLHQVIPVGSLRLWRKAAEALGPAAARRARTISPGWIALLIGAVLAAIALARPVWLSAKPARRIAIAVRPSAELGPDADLADAVTALIDRLDGDDRVQLILPAIMGGASEYLTPAEAAERVRLLAPAPVAAKDLAMPAGGGWRHLYRFGPAFDAEEDGPTTTAIVLPARPGQITIDAFAAEPVADDNVQILLALRNHTDSKQNGSASIRRDDGRPVSLAYSIGPRGRQVLLTQMPAGETFAAAVVGAKGWPARAHLAARRQPAARIAVIGRDDPLLRRFIRINPALALAADSAADAVVAIGVAPPAGIPALVIDPPSPPPACRPGKALADIALRDADVQADHPILADVDLGPVAIRRAAAWRPSGRASDTIVSLDGEVLILALSAPRRIYLAFDTAPDNTNLPLSEAYVALLANVFDYLLGDMPPALIYRSVTPLQAGPQETWRPLGDKRAAPATSKTTPLPAPGLYRDEDGKFHAVSLTGLRSAEPTIDAGERVAALELPEPVARGVVIQLWPALAALAAAAWITGWRLRTN